MFLNFTSLEDWTHVTWDGSDSRFTPPVLLIRLCTCLAWCEEQLTGNHVVHFCKPPSVSKLVPQSQRPLVCCRLSPKISNLPLKIYRQTWQAEKSQGISSWEFPSNNMEGFSCHVLPWVPHGFAHDFSLFLKSKEENPQHNGCCQILMTCKKGVFSKNFHGHLGVIELDDGKIYRKAPNNYMGKSMVSCRFSQRNQSIDIIIPLYPLVIWHSYGKSTHFLAG